MYDPLPPPLTTDDLDIRDCPWMPLEVVRLCDSDLMDQDPAVVVAAIRSWCKAWHQVPAGSLPDNDRALARLLAPHDGLEGWLRLRASGALRGWVKCADGRLYHPVVCTKAVEAMASLRASERRRGYDRDRKKGGVPCGNPEEFRAELRTESNRSSDPIPPPTLHNITLPDSGTSPPPPVVSNAKSEGTATCGDGAKADLGEVKPEKPLSRKAQGMSTVALRLAINSGNVPALVAAFGCSPGFDAEWIRDTDGERIGTIAAILAWRKSLKDAIRLPAGFRAALLTWNELKLDTRKHLAAVHLGALGVEHGIKVEGEGT